MMRIRWTAPAADDLYRIVRYISRNSSESARRVAKTIYDACESLAEFPGRGRKGVEAGTRELIVTSLPYIVVYRILDNNVEVLRIWHGAQQRDG